MTAIIQMQTHDYARAALWDTAIKFSLQSYAMTSPDHLDETLRSTGEMKLMTKFCLCLHKVSELWNLFSHVPMGNCFRCYFMQLFVYLALRTCKKKNDCKILKIILVPDFCPLKPEIARFSLGFCLNFFATRRFILLTTEITCRKPRSETCTISWTKRR